VPNERYVWYQEQVEFSDRVKQEWKECEIDKSSGKDDFVWGLISGFAVGILTVAAIR
jgi:hypothetical protein